MRTYEVLEQAQEGIENEADGGGADLDECGAGDGDDVVLGEVLGGRAGAVGELSRVTVSVIGPSIPLSLLLI